MSEARGAHDSHQTQRLALSQVETLPPRTILEGRYEIIRIIGVGGMGAVYQARDLRFTNVIKVCAEKEMINTTVDPRLRQISVDNFSREANILAALNHPGIPKIYDFFTSGQRSYLVIEFVDGHNLEQIVSSKQGFLDETQVIDWAMQICDVLSYLHNHRPQPIIFRDLKPSNIMVDGHDRVMLVDFGIAKVFQAGEKGTMIGTEGYSPPEQYRGISGPGGDIYALGATMHHLLTRSDPRTEPPFTFHERLPRALNPQISPEMEKLVMKALEYEPENRYASAGEMKQALLGLISAKSLSTGPIASHVAKSMFQTGEVMPQDVHAIWEFVCEDEVRSSPRVHDGVLYAGAYDHNLYALNAQSGALIWKYPTEAGICSSPVVWADHVFFGSEDHVFYSVRTDTGRISWSHPTKDRIRSSPRITFDHVFFGADDGFFYGLNARNGREIWKFQATGPIRSTACTFEDMVFFSCGDGNIYALDMQNGRVRWRFRTNRQVSSSPVMHENLIIVGSHDWGIYALDAQSGFNVWRRRANQAIVATPTIFEDRVYVGSVDTTMYCLDAGSGRIIWKYAAGDQITSSAAVTEEAVFFGCIDHNVYKLDRKHGELVWRFRTGGPVPSSPVAAEDMVYVGSTDNRIYALPL